MGGTGPMFTLQVTAPPPPRGCATDGSPPNFLEVSYFGIYNFGAILETCKESSFWCQFVVGTLKQYCVYQNRGITTTTTR